MKKIHFTLEGYKRHGGYKASEKALKMDPDAVIQLVKDSGLRGRGGAGFPTGMKWGFIPQGDNKDHYLVVNADESEPGTCKDTPLLMANPHVLIEGCIIACHAIRAKHAFIYIRGESYTCCTSSKSSDCRCLCSWEFLEMESMLCCMLVQVHTSVVKKPHFLIH